MEGFRPLDQAQAEIDAVSRTTSRWGAEVEVLPPDSDKKTVLDALCRCNVFHFAGHAQFDEAAPEKTYLPLADGRLPADEIGAALAAHDNPLVLAFMNGCGSSREADWRRGQAVFGLASAFLGNATMFVGAQWPVQDAPAALLAEEFYRHVFPPTNVLLWRWLRRRHLTGVPIAEALRLARLAVAQGGNARTTFQAYVLYGDATSALALS